MSWYQVSTSRTTRTEAEYFCAHLQRAEAGCRIGADLRVLQSSELGLACGCIGQACCCDTFQGKNGACVTSKVPASASRCAPSDCKPEQAVYKSSGSFKTR